VLLNKLKTLKTPTMSLMDNADVIIAGEEDLLGISITYDINKFDSDTQCKDILNGKNTNSVLGVRIKSIYTNLIKTGNNKGREMAKIVIYDSTGTLTGLVFADTWEKMKPLVSEGQNILIKGQKQKENNNFIVRELCQVI
jgi:DNA polymerase III alpha subunit